MKGKFVWKVIFALVVISVFALNAVVAAPAGIWAKASWTAFMNAAIPEELLENELFGHEPGAFTGAEKAMPGKFLAEFELYVMMAIARLGDDAYGATVRREIEERTGAEIVNLTYRDVLLEDEAFVEGGGTLITFGDAGAVDTTANFSTDGTYVLRLTANDGELENFDEVTITTIAAVSGSSSQPISSLPSSSILCAKGSMSKGTSSSPGRCTICASRSTVISASGWACAPSTMRRS